MSNNYHIGTITIPGDAVDTEAVVLACNLVISSGVQVLFKRLERKGTGMVLPFATTSKAAAAQIRSFFPGCTVNASPLPLSLDDKRTLQLAAKVQGVNTKVERVTAAQIAPAAGSTLLDERIVGLEKQVEAIRSIVKAVGTYGREAVDSLHMVFAGPPGVGKTMLANRLLELYDLAGVTSGKGIFMAASATELISPFVGETSHFVKRAFDRADGGLLFIDEAYRLSRQSHGSDGASHGQEAIDAINQLMEERRDRTVVVLAGYKQEMDEFLSRNPGLHGRIGFELEFDGYTDPELLDIFAEMAKGRGFQVNEDALGILEQRLPSLKAQDGFANARTMRKLVDRSIVKKALGNLDRSLGSGDLQMALDDADFVQRRKSPVGFAG